MAILVNFACHPVVFGPDNVMFSADYPGARHYDKTPLAEDAVAIMKQTGQKLGAEATTPSIARQLVAQDMRMPVPNSLLVG